MALREEVDQIGADELELFIENDADLYRQQTIPILKNLWRKIQRGVYDHEKAVTLWGYLVENGAKKYAKEFGDQVWHRMFSVPTRKVVARSLAATGLRQLQDREFSWQEERMNPRGRAHVGTAVPMSEFFDPAVDDVEAPRPDDWEDYPDPGKFEGEPMVILRLYEMAMGGAESLGESEGFGAYNVMYDVRTNDGVWHFIVHEGSTGFFSIALSSQKKSEVEKAWNALEDEYEEWEAEAEGEGEGD